MGNVRDGDLLLGSKPSSSLLILQAAKCLDFPQLIEGLRAQLRFLDMLPHAQCCSWGT